MSSSRWFICFLIFSLVSFSSPAISAEADQADTSNDNLPFNVLLAPSSPAMILLGKSQTSVPRPSSPTDFMVTILQESDNLTKLPKDFAVDFAPFADIKTDVASTQLLRKVLKSMLISVASSVTEAEENSGSTSSLGFGLSFSILKGSGPGDTDSNYKSFKTLAPKIKAALGEGHAFYYDALLDNAGHAAPNMGSFQTMQIYNMMDAIKTKGMTSEESKYREGLSPHDVVKFMRAANQIANTPYRRKGFKLDIAGGLTMDFPGQTTRDGKAALWGLWTTMGYEWNRSALTTVIRYLGDLRDPAEGEKKQSSLDWGFRASMNSPGKAFSTSFEAVVRHFSEDEDRDAEYRLALQADYVVAKNKTLSFTFGRDFEGEQSGNLLALANLILGFGSQRNVEGMKKAPKKKSDA